MAEKKTWKEKRAARKARNIQKEAERRRDEGDTSKYVQEYFGGEFGNAPKKSYTPKEVKTGNARDDWRANQGLRNIQDQQAKKAAADAARADIIKRSQTGNVDRSDYEGGRHKYGMSVDDYHNMMATVPQNKYADMFPKSAGIPKLFSALGNLIPGMTMATNILNSIKGSDAGTMAKDLVTNPLKNLYQNITGNKATNPEAVSLVDNDWQEISDSTYNKLFKKENQPENIWWDVDATTADEDRMIPPIDQGLAEYYNKLKMQGPEGEEVIDDFSETIEDVPTAYAQFPNQGDIGFPWKMSESGHLLDPALNPGLDLSSYGDPGIESWTPAKEQKLNALLAKQAEKWDTGLGTLTEPTPYPEADENVDPNYWSSYTLPLQYPTTWESEILSPAEQGGWSWNNPPEHGFDENYETEIIKNIPYIQQLLGANQGLFNRGGIASLQYGGDPGYEPGMFTPGTTITDEETYDIQPLQMDPGIMGIPDLEDLFEEAKVKESIFDKLKYVNNTMHG